MEGGLVWNGAIRGGMDKGPDASCFPEIDAFVSSRVGDSRPRSTPCDDARGRRRVGTTATRLDRTPRRGRIASHRTRRAVDHPRSKAIRVLGHLPWTARPSTFVSAEAAISLTLGLLRLQDIALACVYGVLAVAEVRMTRGSRQRRRDHGVSPCSVESFPNRRGRTRSRS